MAPFIGDDDLVSHLLRLMWCGGLDIEVSFAEPLDPSSSTREQLAEAARAAICEALSNSALEPAPEPAGEALLTA